MKNETVPSFVPNFRLLDRPETTLCVSIKNVNGGGGIP
jgi:hypothetical protein